MVKIASGMLLKDQPTGWIGRVVSTDLPDSEAAMLRAMGLRPGAVVRVCRRGTPTVVEVVSGHQCKCHCRCRIGIASEVCGSIVVDRESH